MWPVGALLYQFLRSFGIDSLNLSALCCFLTQDSPCWSCVFLAPDLELAMPPKAHVHFISSSLLVFPGTLDSVTHSLLLETLVS